MIALHDFLDEGIEIQSSLLEFLHRDKNNTFLLSVYNFIKSNFNDFIEYEKGLMHSKKQKDKVYFELRAVINKKIEAIFNGIWVLKMACEGHFEPM